MINGLSKKVVFFLNKIVAKLVLSHSVLLEQLWLWQTVAYSDILLVSTVFILVLPGEGLPLPVCPSNLQKHRSKPNQFPTFYALFLKDLIVI